MSDELIEIRCESITWRGGDWIGVFRPNKRDEAHCIAKFKVRGKILKLNIILTIIKNMTHFYKQRTETLFVPKYALFHMVI